MIRRAVDLTRYVVIVAVLSTLLSSMALLIYGALMEVRAVLTVLLSFSVCTKAGKSLALSFIEATDIFLIGIVLFIFSLGLYRLFVDDQLPLPPWLEIRNLEDLKAQLVSVVIAALAVIFLGFVVQWEDESQLFPLGVAIALVIAALAFFLKTRPLKME